MATFAIFMPGGKDLVEQQFPDAFALEEGSLWIVGSRLPNSSSVKEQLVKADGPSIVVLRVADYYGYYNQALWQRIQVWERQY